MEKVLLIDKPKGITSYDVIRILKKRYPSGTKIGHAGTLDPNATGLMIVGVGHGTKKLKEFVGLNKVYDAEILFGLKTNTGDVEGKVLEEKAVGEIDKEKIEKVLGELAGKHIFPVSKYSSTKIGGTPAHKLARQNKKIPDLKREMEIFWTKFVSLHEKVLKIELEVSSGTYIRSMAEEIGKKLDLPATLKNLRRTKIGDFKIEDAEKI